MKYTNSIYLWGSEEHFDSFLKEVAIYQRDYCWKFDLPGHSFDGIELEFVSEESMYFEYVSDSFEFQESSDITGAYTLTKMHPNVEISCHAESKQANDIAWIIYLSGKRTLEGRSTYYAPEAPCPDRPFNLLRSLN